MTEVVAVDAVSIEPVSADFPVNQGKYREISRITPESDPRALRSALIFLLFFANFPKRHNREFSESNREFWARNREFG